MSKMNKWEWIITLDSCFVQYWVKADQTHWYVHVFTLNLFRPIGIYVTSLLFTHIDNVHVFTLNQLWPIGAYVISLLFKHIDNVNVFTLKSIMTHWCLWDTTSL